MFNQLHKIAKELPPKQDIADLSKEKKICVYAPLIKTVCGVIKVIFIWSSPVRIGMDGIIELMNEMCPAN